MHDSLPQILLVLTAGAVLLPSPPRRSLAMVGVVAVGLAIAAFTVRLGDGPPRSLALRAIESNTPATFLRINAALLLTGLALGLVAAVLARVRDRDRSAGTALASLLLLVGSIALIIGLVPLARYVGWGGILLVAVVIGAALLGLASLARLLRLAAAWEWLDRHLLERRPPALLPAASTRFDIAWLAGLMVAAVAMCLAPSLRAVSLATMIAATVSHVLVRRLGAGPVIPVLPLLAAFIIPVFSYLTAITGDPNPLMASLPDAPLSTAAEIRLVPWVAIAAWGFAGLWPLQGVSLGLVAPLAGVLLIRLAAHPLPGGLEHWTPLFMPIILVGLWHAAVTSGVTGVRRRRVQAMLVAIALFGITAGGDGVTGAYWFLAAAAVFPWIASVRTSIPLGAGRLAWLPLAWAALIIITAGLRTQVTYSVLTAAGIAVAFWSARQIGARDSH